MLNSFYEGWSLAATEALITGVPLIHSNCGSAYQLAGENQERGIVVPNPACAPLDLTGEQVQRKGYTSQQANTDILAGAMAQMIDERFAWLEKKDSIRDYAVDNFSFERTLDSYSRLIRQTLGY